MSSILPMSSATAPKSNYKSRSPSSLEAGSVLGAVGVSSCNDSNNSALLPTTSNVTTGLEKCTKGLLGSLESTGIPFYIFVSNMFIIYSL